TGRYEVEQDGAAVGFDEVRPDDARRAEVEKVQRFRSAKRASPTGRAQPRGRRRDPRPTRAQLTVGPGSWVRRRASRLLTHVSYVRGARSGSRRRRATPPA